MKELDSNATWAYHRNNNTACRGNSVDTGAEIRRRLQMARPHDPSSALDAENRLSRVLYQPRQRTVCHRPSNYNDGSVLGKMPVRLGLWFLDQKDGMGGWSALSSMGLLSRFVDMLTDSRSFLIATRYFRRILCNLLGDDAGGELPADRVKWWKH